MSKKVLYFIPEFPRISETFIEREVSKLIDFGNLDIQVFSLQKATGTTSDIVLEKTLYRRLNLVTDFPSYLAFTVKNFSKIAKSFKLILGDDRLGLCTRVWHFIKGIGYAMLFERLSPDHLHSHFFSEPSNIAMVAASILEISFSISAHARDVFIDWTLLPTKAREAKFVTACNKRAWEESVKRAGQEYKDKIHLIYHGIDHERIFSTPPQMEKPDKPVIFLGGTRLVEKKGIKYVIEASKILKERGIDHIVNLVGPGPLYQDYVELIDKLDLNNTVVIHGGGKGTPFAVVADHYKIADVFVFPSYETSEGDMDGVATVVIEAAMAKLPIVTTTAGSIPDLIDETNGVIIPQKNPKAIADAVEKLLLDEGLRAELGSKAYSKAVDMFDIEKNIGALEDLFLSK